MAVYEAHKDIICQKSGKTLFGTTKANAQHLSTLKHIRRRGESSVVKICSDLLYCRRRRAEEDAPIEMNTRSKQVVIDDNDSEGGELHAQNYDGDTEANDEFDSSTSSPLHQLRKERVKNDIEHIFLRFRRVLSKEHGAYYSFITSLLGLGLMLDVVLEWVCSDMTRQWHGEVI